ncbi:PspC domain-containing protein [Aliifodinibius sp. S!AR15-10]|uniref:PspC domain-containing protein n=1 Tax=Aliifodinibius sp. S!AR15-10 TaxID=2950437 RepID=UPI00285772C7|nr:PspC domain-containing protein [Aliifodinibius sp. S!AR15-10]MDR8393128.1 PspC domain-containing protein [Aliifodinibius sp. S!AR15-10]
MGARLSKSRTDKMIAGVCGGIAEYLGWDPTIVRIIFVVLTIMGWGSPVLLYFILALVMPD